MVVNFKPPRGPNTLTSSVRARDDAIASSDGRYVSRTTTRDEGEDEDGRFVRLRVEVVDDDDDDDASTSASCDARFDAYVHETCAAAGRTFARRGGGALGGASVRFASRRGVPRGCVRLSEAQRHNLRACADKEMEFEAIDVDAIDVATDVTVELSVVDARAVTSVVDAKTARRAVVNALGAAGRVVSTSEVYVISIEDIAYRARIAEVNTLCEEEKATAIAYHCFRARVGMETTFFARSSDENRLRFKNDEARQRRSPCREIIHVHTRDGEVFHVHRRLLRSCIALTGAVRRAGGALGEDGGRDDVVRANIDVETDVFDRVLVFLECAAMGKTPPNYEIRIMESLCDAAKSLGCRELGDFCEAKLGVYASRLREFEWDEIVALNDAGGVLCVIDGMVLDVKRWLPEHPGGDFIIPNQSLNIDAARHFEMYHSSKESFLYLKEFYVGEVRVEDKSRMPVPAPPASENFLSQLREWTTFRLGAGERTKPRAHLGQN